MLQKLFLQGYEIMKNLMNEDMFRCKICGNNEFWGPLFQPREWKCKFCGNKESKMLENKT